MCTEIEARFGELRTYAMNLKEPMNLNGFMWQHPVDVCDTGANG